MSDWRAHGRAGETCLNPYYTGSTLWVYTFWAILFVLFVLILIILEVLYEMADISIYKMEAFFVLILIILEVLYEIWNS